MQTSSIEYKKQAQEKVALELVDKVNQGNRWLIDDYTKTNRV